VHKHKIKKPRRAWREVRRLKKNWSYFKKNNVRVSIPRPSFKTTMVLQFVMGYDILIFLLVLSPA
jgi:hypothetical protein